MTYVHQIYLHNSGIQRSQDGNFFKEQFLLSLTGFVLLLLNIEQLLFFFLRNVRSAPLFLKSTFPVFRLKIKSICNYNLLCFREDRVICSEVEHI